ncbi:hypothetical protein H8959_009497 [Pygathrix nigripes]
MVECFSKISRDADCRAVVISAMVPSDSILWLFKHNFRGPRGGDPGDLGPGWSPGKLAREGRLGCALGEADSLRVPEEGPMDRPLPATPLPWV